VLTRTTDTGAVVSYSKNNGALVAFSSGATLGVVNGDTLWFDVIRSAKGSSSGTITIVNQSDSNTQVSSFAYSVTHALNCQYC
jgi:hypothetical protein